MLLYYFGGGIWRPLKARVLGEKTVALVIKELQPSMRQKFSDLEELTDGRSITILAFKEERVLEVWKKNESRWRAVCSYPFTGFSGELGPQLIEGDGQIPEGVYEVEYLSPNSSFHLSMKIDYPNDFDSKMGDADGRKQLDNDRKKSPKKSRQACNTCGHPTQNCN